MTELTLQERVVLEARNLPPGFSSPWIHVEDSMSVLVTHRAGTGRLPWRVVIDAHGPWHREEAEAETPEEALAAALLRFTT